MANIWKNLSLPVKVGIGFGAAGLVLALIGIARGNVPLRPSSIAMALLIWGRRVVCGELGCGCSCL